MRLIIPAPEELRQALATGAAVWRTPTRSCDDDAAPPPIVLQRALESIAAHPEAAAWLAPRLFWVPEIGAIVGSGRFKRLPDHPQGVEIGYGVGAAHLGRGYASAGVRLMIAEAFAHPSVQELVARAQPDNLASIRVLEKCGFVPEPEGRYPDDRHYLRFHLRRV
jgi:ribosomal-protein-alanine N-acetyltransferase